jgi:signal transduction histidine kinase
MRVYWASLLWHDHNDPEQSVMHTAGQPEKIVSDIHPEKLPAIITFMQTQLYPVTSPNLDQAIGMPLSEVEQDLLDYPAVRLWVPIQGRGGSLGLLILGPKFGGDLFDHNDMEILDMVSRHASVTFQNVQLIKELKAKAHESEQYKKEIIRTREEERKRISRELHDLVIQVLVGLKYQIAHLQSSLKQNKSHLEAMQDTVALQNKVGDLIQTTRILCQDLRPAALDLGLIPSIRSLVGSYAVKTDIEVALALEGERDIPIDEDIALCIYRCTGEALSNIRKHAAAQEIAIKLCINPSIVSLTVKDNGRGFQVPERLGSLMTQNHFGLVGMRERVKLLHGQFSIFSDPAYGTQLEVSIPLKPNHLEEL